MKKWRLAQAAAALLCCTAAGAQTQGPGGRIVYEAAFFKPFSPSNALEIVQRVPGFTLDAGSADVRGFSQAAGNVVINGQRPSSKTDTLQTILARIPASRVARVEIGPGDLFGSDYAGKAQVLNLVLVSSGGLAGNAVATLRRDFTGKLFPEGSVSALVRRGRSSFNAALQINNNFTSEEGYDTLKALPGEDLIEYRRKVNRIQEPNGAVSASWDYNGGDNRTAHLNLRGAFDRFALTQYNDVIPAVGPVRDDLLTQRYRQRNVEIGGDVTRPLLGGGLKLVGLATRRRRHNVDLSLNRVQDDVLGGSEQDLRDERDETLLRLAWSRKDLLGWSVEAGAEGVLNRLDSNVNLYALDAAGGRTRIDLPVDQAVVKEYRGEAFVNAGRPLTKRLRLDLGLNYEASRLTVTGDAEAERVLRFWKPKASLDWHPPGAWHLQLSVARTVAQLQFEDFISTAELTNSRVNGGNADLVPQRAWEVLATIERPILKDGRLKIEAGSNFISLVQDRVPTPEGFDAPGNLGDGRVNILRTTLDAPLTKFGVPGGRLTVYVSYVGTSVEDPYTHRQRRFSGNSAFVYDINFRQDRGKFAWGIEATGNTPSTFYRLDERDRNWSQQPYLIAFVEYRPGRKTIVSLTVNNAADLAAFRRRTFFFPDRRTPIASEVEFRMRNSHIIPALSFKRSFG